MGERKPECYCNPGSCESIANLTCGEPISYKYTQTHPHTETRSPLVGPPECYLCQTEGLCSSCCVPRVRGREADKMGQDSARGKRGQRLHRRMARKLHAKQEKSVAEQRGDETQYKFEEEKERDRERQRRRKRRRERVREGESERARARARL